jgi:fructuronate reductase
VSGLPRLSRATLAELPPECRPLVDPGSLRTRIVHLGIGAFHRAHQAFHTELAESRHGGGWGIAGVTQRSPAVAQALRPQDGLYSLTVRDPLAPATRVVAAVTDVLYAAEDGERLTGLIASPDVTVVTATVSEKGYRRDPATGGLDTADPLVAADLCGGPAPATVVGQIATGLRARRRTGAPVSVVCCDNMADNGTVLRRLVRDFTEAAAWEDRDALLEWLERAVAFPATLVDRIAPAVGDADREAAARALGADDRGAVVAEPFSQWVLEDAFAADRPRWESAGAQLVADVAPYQLAKLRLLNGAHSLLAYRGLAAGCRTVADVLDTPWGEGLVRAYAAEVAPTLPPAPDLDIPRYVDSLIERFANPAMHHRLRQICSDGTLKIPERWLAPLRELRAAGRGTPVLEAGLAAWALHTRDAAQQDPAAERLRTAWTHPRPEALRRLVGLLGAPDLADDAGLLAAVDARFRELDASGRPGRTPR